MVKPADGQTIKKTEIDIGQDGEQTSLTSSLYEVATAPVDGSFESLELVSGFVLTRSHGDDSDSQQYAFDSAFLACVK